MKLPSATALVLLSMASLPACENAVAIPHLYGFSIEDQTRAARHARLDHTWSELRRNSDGTRLYCLFTHRKRVLALSSEGKAVLEAPGLVSYLSDAGTFVAWSDDIRLGFHLVGGKFVSTAWSGGRSGNFGVEPGGRYFFLAREPRRTVVSTVDEPDTVLADSAFQGENLFHRNGCLYLFGRIHDSQSYQREIFADVFEFRAGAWQRTRSIRIPRDREGPSPFRVVDMEPWSERVLLVDVRDGPFPSRYYLYDLASGTRLRVKVLDNPLVFLKSDILKTLS